MTLITELGVTAAVVYIIRKTYTTGTFLRRLAFGVLAYEVVVNISYMSYRALEHLPEHADKAHEPFELALAIFHGTFSLVMFLALILFFVIAAKRYAAGENYFSAHPKLTVSFLVAWSISILSGALFFVLLYLL